MSTRGNWAVTYIIECVTSPFAGLFTEAVFSVIVVRCRVDECSRCVCCKGFLDVTLIHHHPSTVACAVQSQPAAFRIVTGSRPCSWRACYSSVIFESDYCLYLMGFQLRHFFVEMAPVVCHWFCLDFHSVVGGFP